MAYQLGDTAETRDPRPAALTQTPTFCYVNTQHLKKTLSSSFLSNLPGKANFLQDNAHLQAPILLEV